MVLIVESFANFCLFREIKYQRNVEFSDIPSKSK